MNKKSIWVVTGALGIVGLGAGVASAGSGVSGETSFDESPAVQVANLDMSTSATPSPAAIDLTTTPPSAVAVDDTAALTQMTSNTSVSTVSPVSPVSPVSVQSPVSPPSVQSPISAQSSS